MPKKINRGRPVKTGRKRAKSIHSASSSSSGSGGGSSGGGSSGGGSSGGGSSGGGSSGGGSSGGGSSGGGSSGGGSSGGGSSGGGSSGGGSSGGSSGSGAAAGGSQVSGRSAFEQELLDGYALDPTSTSVLWEHYVALSRAKKAGNMVVGVLPAALYVFTAGVIPSPVKFAKDIKAMRSNDKHIDQLFEIRDFVSCSCPGKRCDPIVRYVLGQKSKKWAKKVNGILSFFFPPIGWPCTIYQVSRAAYKSYHGIKGVERERVATLLYESRQTCNMAHCIIVELLGKNRASQLVFSNAAGAKEKGIKAIADHIKSL